MIECGVDVSYETTRRWVDKFGSTYAKRIAIEILAKALLYDIFTPKHLGTAYTHRAGTQVITITHRNNLAHQLSRTDGNDL